MLAALLILAVAAVSLSAEQVSCVEGENKCKGRKSYIIINNKHYCCEKDFNLVYKNQENNANQSSSCACDRQIHEIDCLEGFAKCQNASSLISDGYTTKCCEYGYNMNSVSNSIINGIRVNYCKCTRYGSITSFGGRPMTKEEQAQFKQAMGNFSQNLKAEMNQMQKKINENLSNVRTRLDGLFGGGFLTGLTRNSNHVANVAGDSTLQSGNINQTGSARNIARPIQSRSPWQGSIWDLQQRRLQQLQSRLNGIGLTFWDRLSRNPAISQMMSPHWWFGNIWSGLYGNRNQTA